MDTQKQMVQATQAGFYRATYIERGMTFALVSVSDFSAKWMVKVGPEAVDMIKPADPRRQTRPGERPAVSVLAPLPTAPGAKPGDVTRVKTPTGDESVI